MSQYIDPALEPILREGAPHNVYDREAFQKKIGSPSGPRINSHMRSEVIASESLWYDSGPSNGIAINGNTRKRYYVYDDASSVCLHFANIHSRDSLVSNNITVSAGIELPDGSIHPVFFGASRKVEIEPGAMVASSPVAVDLRGGKFIYVRTFVEVAEVGMQWPYQGWPHSFTIPEWGEGCDSNNDTPQVDKTLSGNIVASSVSGYSPFLITGTRESDRITVGIIGDSIAAGVGDSGTQQEGGVAPVAGRGFVRRALNNEFPYVSIAASAETTAEARTLRLGVIPGCSTVICTLGINDLQNGITAAQLKERAIALWGRITRLGPEVFVCTLTPMTTSTDNWATVANQTPTGLHAARIAYNDWIRDGAPLFNGNAAAIGGNFQGVVRMGEIGHPVAGFFELADAVESSRNSGLWAVGMVHIGDGYGIHPSGAGHTAMAAAIDTSRLSFSAPVPPEENDNEEPTYDADAGAWFDRVENAGSAMGRTPAEVSKTKLAASNLFVRLKAEDLIGSIDFLLLPGPTTAQGFVAGAIGNTATISNPGDSQYDRIRGVKGDAYGVTVDTGVPSNDLPQNSRHTYIYLTEFESPGLNTMPIFSDAPGGLTEVSAYDNTTFVQLNSEDTQSYSIPYEEQGFGLNRTSATVVQLYYQDELFTGGTFTLASDNSSTDTIKILTNGVNPSNHRFSVFSMGAAINLNALGSAVRDYIAAITPTVAERLAIGIDGLLDATSPANREVYSTRYSGNQTFTRNANFWAASLVPKIACASVYNDQADPDAGGFWRAGTLITPRHVLFAKHYPIQVGVNLYFAEVSGGGNVVREVIAIADAADCDFQVALLDAAVTTIAPAVLAPTVANLTAAIGNPAGIPGLATNAAEEFAGVVEVDEITNGEIIFRTPGDSLRAAMQLSPISGDSGNPIWLGGGEFLAGLWKDNNPDKGDYIGAYLTQINNAIAAADASASVSTGLVPSVWTA